MPGTRNMHLSVSHEAEALHRIADALVCLNSTLRLFAQKFEVIDAQTMENDAEEREQLRRRKN